MVRLGFIALITMGLYSFIGKINKTLLIEEKINLYSFIELKRIELIGFKRQEKSFILIYLRGKVIKPLLREGKVENLSFYYVGKILKKPLTL